MADIRGWHELGGACYDKGCLLRHHTNPLDFVLVHDGKRHCEDGCTVASHFVLSVSREPV